jgi:hypothetical protein
MRYILISFIYISFIYQASYAQSIESSYGIYNINLAGFNSSDNLGSGTNFNIGYNFNLIKKYLKLNTGLNYISVNGGNYGVFNMIQSIGENERFLSNTPLKSYSIDLNLKPQYKLNRFTLSGIMGINIYYRQFPSVTYETYFLYNGLKQDDDVHTLQSPIGVGALLNLGLQINYEIFNKFSIFSRLIESSSLLTIKDIKSTNQSLNFGISYAFK